MWAGTIVVALAVRDRPVLRRPRRPDEPVQGPLGSAFLFWLVEGLLRTAIFLGYLWLLSRLRDLRRVFEYHGAEHKTISCYEAGLPLTPAERRSASRACTRAAARASCWS